MKEKVAVLIDKLQELKKEDAAISELSHYTKLLYAELMCAKSENDKKKSTKKVSVIMPGYDSQRRQERREEAVAEEMPASSKQVEEASVEEERKTTTVAETYRTPPKEVVQDPQPALWDQPAVEKQEAPKQEKQPPKELNDLIAEQRPSLNDRLKTEREELANRLGNSPVKDLHHAIGLNEKFGFINELFRGDQSLYDRSIKTINECNDLEEALYWIDRELKIKLGWQDKHKTVQRFYALIRKRFS